MKVIFAVCTSILLTGVILAPNANASIWDTLKSAVEKATKEKPTEEKPASSANTAAKPTGEVTESSTTYAGYSQNFLQYKTLLELGQAAEVYQQREKILVKEEKDPNYLFSLEQALVALDAGQSMDAITYLTHAERIIDDRQGESKTSGFFSSLGTELVKAVGFDEYGKYDGAPYERILMLNFKSIAYMLDGDRRAYNVTRRSIDWQNREKKIFDQKMEKVKDDIRKEESEQTEKGNDVGAMDLFSIISEQYKKSESKALQLSSAFVNPFGFYMAGIVQEFDSYEDVSLRDNARISYKKALDLNPGSKIIKQAVKEIQQKAPKGKRLVHVVVSNGFAPEKKVLQLDYDVSGSIVPIKLTIYEPDESAVHRIEVQNRKGKTVAKLGVVADIDAITMRHQYDSLPEQHLRMTLSIIRSVFEGQLFAKMGVLGGFAKTARDESTNPDMRSWMSMPKQVLAARFYLPKGKAGLQLVSFNKKGKVLVRKPLDLDSNEHSFVYARSLDDVMYINRSKSMWVAMR